MKVRKAELGKALAIGVESDAGTRWSPQRLLGVAFGAVCARGSSTAASAAASAASAASAATAAATTAAAAATAVPPPPLLAPAHYVIIVALEIGEKARI